MKRADDFQLLCFDWIKNRATKSNLVWIYSFLIFFYVNLLYFLSVYLLTSLINEMSDVIYIYIYIFQTMVLNFPFFSMDFSFFYFVTISQIKEEK